MHKCIDYTNKKYIKKYLFLKFCPPIFYGIVLKLIYKNRYKQNLNLKNPQRLTEKIQWLKLNQKSELKSLLSDKIEAKIYVKSKIPELKFAKVYQTADTFEQLNFNELPKSFILKTNHSWKTNTIIEDKTNLIDEELNKLKEYYNNALKINYAFWSYFELQYKDIKPKVFAEEIIGTKEELIEYEIYCFNGKVEIITYRTFDKYYKFHEGYKQHFYDRNWKKLNFSIGPNFEEECKRPENLEKVIIYSENLSKEFSFVRLDFMEKAGELYFCEFTFTPFSGFANIRPREYDIIYGKKLELKV